MKFSCEKALLQTAITTSARAVAGKSTIPALEGILLEAGDDLRLTGNNLEIGIRTIVPADVQRKGSMVASARLLGEIVRRLPDDVVMITANDLMLNIQCGMSEFNIMGTPADEFPALPTVEYQNSFELQQSTLRSMINETLFAVSGNDSRPVLTGSLFEINEKGLTIVSVDGFRLALRREAVERKEGAAAFSFIVPGSSLSEVEKICADSEAPASVTQGSRHVMFKVGDTMLISRRLEGEFMAYEKSIPRNNPIHIYGDTRALITSIDRVSLLISEKFKSPLRCLFEKDMLRIDTKTAIGNATDQCPVEGDGGGLEIGFNNKYLMDALKAAPADRVRLELGTRISSCVIVPAEGEENFLYMVLPTRLRADD
ncbi:MAG TPA: DNA polymerase III subunit beta [Pseudoflavonifractor sp.]|nr:DNA polymerase III subunit beta [Pseudoflavonifractor sp.]